MFATSVSSGTFIVVDTVFSLSIVFGVSPGFVTFTLPSLSTWICSSIKPEFAFITASLTAFISSADKFVLSFTATFAGSFNSSAGFAVPSNAASASFNC